MLTGVPIVLPITNGGNFARTAGFAVPLDGTTTSVSGVVRCDQPRALDLRARGGRHIDSVPDFILEDVIARVSAILE
jgi:mRNA-degrading endonuclease toxin of MazEF toxin-antitoxin module